jgi:hypothetical protein
MPSGGRTGQRSCAGNFGAVLEQELGEIEISSLRRGGHGARGVSQEMAGIGIGPVLQQPLDEVMLVIIMRNENKGFGISPSLLFSIRSGNAP